MAYALSGESTISFFRADETSEAMWGSDCTDIYEADPEITVLNVTSPIKINDGFSGWIFSGNKNLQSMDLRGLDVSAVTSMNSMFYNCSSLTSLDLSGWNTSGVETMRYMFYDCSSLSNLNLSGWNTSNVESMYYMFYNCSALTSLDLSHFNTSAVTDMESMFRNCSALTSLNTDSWVTSKVTAMQSMFQNCSALPSLDLSHWDTSAVTSMDSMFRNCTSLTSLDLHDWNVSSATSMTGMFFNDSTLTSPDLSGWTPSAVTTLNQMFENCSSLTSLDLSGWNLNNAADLSRMFRSCSSLSSLNVKGWNTSKVQNMNYMFNGCLSLAALDLSSWDFSAVTSMYNVFDGCDKLHTLTFGSNDIKYSLFEELPAAGSSWYYVAPDETLEHPLDLMTKKTNKELFTAYNPNTMAGTWSMETLAKRAIILDPDRTVINRKAITLDTHEIQLMADCDPSWVTEFTWTSSDPDIASVSAEGKVSFLKSGTVTITLEAGDVEEKISAYASLTNTVPAESVTIKDPDGIDISGKTVTIHNSSYQLMAAPIPETALQKFEWSSSDSGTASVDAYGIVSFLKAGTVTITAETVDGSGISGDVTLIWPEEDPAEIIPEAEIILDGNTIDLDDYVTSAIGEVHFSIDGDSFGCSIDPKNHVLKSGNQIGTVTVTVTIDDSDNYRGKTGTITVSVIDKKTAELEVTQDGIRYGETLPDPKYTAPESTFLKTVLYSGEEYDSSEEPPTKPGVYTVTVTCETKDTIYTGIVNFAIEPKPLTDDSITARLLPDNKFTWTGETFLITGAEVYDGERLLTEGTDYELSGVMEASDVGKYEVTISAGKESSTFASSEAKVLSESNYTGQIILTWQIVPAPIPTSEPPQSMNFLQLCQDCLLPETGFSSVRPSVLREQPQALRYEPLRMRIQIPSLDVDTELVWVPISEDIWPVEWLGEQAGLLAGTELPGQGLSVVVAHNTLNTTEYGPFALLFTLEENDLITVIGHDGSIKLFRVYANALLEANDAEKLAALAGEGNSLVLLTCENESVEGGYLNRRAVFARPVEYE